MAGSSLVVDEVEIDVISATGTAGRAERPTHKHSPLKEVQNLAHSNLFSYRWIDRYRHDMIWEPLPSCRTVQRVSESESH